MYELTDPNTIKSLMARHGFSFSKALGQNFLINPSVCPRMAEFADGAGVIEIGAGIGVLTKELAGLAKKVVTFELDKRLIPLLAETLSEFDNVMVINQDIMKANIPQIINEHFAGMDVVVCANLPYYITSPVIMYLLESKLPLEQIVVMVQKEAADRLCAPVGSRESGAVTVAAEYYAEREILFDVGRESFMPPPKVDSSVIRLTPRNHPDIELSDEKLFFAMVKAAFGQRRKTILNSISAGTGISKEAVARAADASEIRLDARAEKLSMKELASLANNLEIQNY